MIERLNNGKHRVHRTECIPQIHLLNRNVLSAFVRLTNTQAQAYIRKPRTPSYTIFALKLPSLLHHNTRQGMSAPRPSHTPTSMMLSIYSMYYPTVALRQPAETLLNPDRNNLCASITRQCCNVHRG